jgi:hypothetical protein
MTKARIGLTGSADMGQNLVSNIECNGYTVAVYNRTARPMLNFVAEWPGKKFIGCEALPISSSRPIRHWLISSSMRPHTFQLVDKPGTFRAEWF